MKSAIIQGYKGSFHDQAARQLLGLDNEVIFAESFESQIRRFQNSGIGDYAVIAIENSIAGTILQNYNLLRNYNVHVIGECYLKIEHQLMALPNQALNDIRLIRSHPMAIRQCYKFLNTLDHVKIEETEDTALSAIQIRESNLEGVAAIASHLAAEQNELHILQSNIQDQDYNYTRFFLVSREPKLWPRANKASIWCTLDHTPGSLSKLLSKIGNSDINLSQIHSYPVMENPGTYFFHLDLEFENLELYEKSKSEFKKLCMSYGELGIYEGRTIQDYIMSEKERI